MIHELFSKKKPIYSIEVFPPKKTDDISIIYEALDQFKMFKPDFISVTYGAGGSNSGEALAIASYIQNKCGIEALSHVTCASLQSEEKLSQFVKALSKENVGNVLALRGDQPRDLTIEEFENRHFKHASDLAMKLKKDHNLCVAGACYPEKHPEASSFEEDIQNLKTKVDMGTDLLITQLFYDNDCFYRFVEMVRNAGITIPITAGLMPITSTSQIKNIISLSGASIPPDLAHNIAKYSDNAEDLKKAGLEYTKKQMNELVSHGADGIHLYSMNKVDIADFIYGDLFH